jgi:hypothetical protein
VSGLVDALLLLLVISISAATAIVIFRAYQCTTDRIIGVVESNTRALEAMSRRLDVLAKGQEGDGGH